MAGNLFYEWRKDWFSVNASLFYMYQHNPVMEKLCSQATSSSAPSTTRRVGRRWNPELQLQAGPLFGFVTFNATAGMNYFDSHGNDYRHYYTNWYYRFETMMNYKNYTLILHAQNHNNDFYGETAKSGESLFIVMARYRIKNANIGLMILNPFSSRDDYRRPTVNYSRYAPSNQSMHVRESARMVAVTFNVQNAMPEAFLPIPIFPEIDVQNQCHRLFLLIVFSQWEINAQPVRRRRINHE